VIVGDDVSKLEAIKIVTRCTSREQFVAMFRKFCNPTSCFIPSMNMRPVGKATAFSLRLADGTPLLRGHGIVLASWPTDQNAFGRPGVHLGIQRLTNDSVALFEDLLMPRSAATRIPIGRQLRLIHETAPHNTAEVADRAERSRPTIETPPLEKLDAPRLPGADFVLPANPLTEMDDDLLAAFIDSSLTVQEAIPDEVAGESTQPNPSIEVVQQGRDPIATILGMQPLRLTPVFAPTLVKTELVEPMRAVTVQEPDEDRAKDDVVPAPWWQTPLGAASHWWSTSWTATTTVVAMLVTLGMVTIAWARSTPELEPASIPAPPVVSQPVVTPPPAPAPPPAEPEEIAMEPTCKLVVSTTPPHAYVRMGKQLVGKSPVTITGPCTNRTIEVAHPRYRTKQVMVGDETSVHVKLDKRRRATAGVSTATAR
jgi:hypothetical protein